MEMIIKSWSSNDLCSIPAFAILTTGTLILVWGDRPAISGYSHPLWRVSETRATSGRPKIQQSSLPPARVHCTFENATGQTRMMLLPTECLFLTSKRSVTTAQWSQMLHAKLSSDTVTATSQPSCNKGLTWPTQIWIKDLEFKLGLCLHTE